MRAINRVAGFLLGLLLVAAGLILIVEAALVGYGRDPWPFPLDRWHAALRATPVGDDRILALSIVVGLVGLLLLALELRPWPPQRVAAVVVPDTVWWLSRRSVESRAAGAAGSVAGVHRARARVRGRKRRWRLRVRADADPSHYEAVHLAVTGELRRWRAPAEVGVAVNLSRRGPA